MKDYVPREIQRLAHDFAVDHERCALHMGCGTGKTSATLSVVDTLMLCGDTEKTLVIGPKRVARKTWREEVNKWNQFSHIRVANLAAELPVRTRALRSNADIYTINYELLPWLVKTLGREWPFDTVVADEATKLKGFRLRQGSTRAQALGKVAFAVVRQKPLVRRFIELTGTPAANGIKDLWGQMWFLDKGSRLGYSHTDFVERYFRTGRDGFSLEPLPHSFDLVTSAISDLCLSLEAKDFFDLPGVLHNVVYVDLPKKAMAQYRDMEREMFVELQHVGVEAFSAAGKVNKCLQIANGAIYFDEKRNWEAIHDEKLDALESIVEEANGKPIMVAYNYRSDLARLEQRFPQGRVCDTEKDEDDFKAGEIPILFCHPDSVGHGVDGFQNVTNEIAFFGLGWNLETRSQLIDRIGETRQYQAGKDMPVVVHDIVARGTVDETVLERIDTKAELQDLLLQRLKRNKK